MIPPYLQDASLIVAIFNFANTFANIFWTLKLRSVQGNGELIKILTSQSKGKDEVIRDLKKENREMKLQYENAIVVNKSLEGQIRTYKEFNKHNPVIETN